jgi:hypothetical protein
MMMDGGAFSLNVMSTKNVDRKTRAKDEDER